MCVCVSHRECVLCDPGNAEQRVSSRTNGRRRSPSIFASFVSSPFIDRRVDVFTGDRDNLTTREEPVGPTGAAERRVGDHRVPQQARRLLLFHQRPHGGSGKFTITLLRDGSVALKGWFFFCGSPGGWRQRKAKSSSGNPRRRSRRPYRRSDQRASTQREVGN